MRYALAAGVALGVALPGVPAGALDIEGVLIGSADQPRINAAVTLPGSPGTPLTAGEPGFETFNIQAFYDTGASGVLMSKETADQLGVPLQAGAVFEDVGVGGTDAFNISQDVLIRLAPFTAPFGGGADIDNPATFTSTYNQSFGPLRMQVAQQNSDVFVGGLDVFGMPLFQNKVVTIDPSRLNAGELELVETNVYDAGAVPTGLPAADYHIQTSYGDFERFTRTTGGQPPTLNDNPFIGPDPTAGLPGGSGNTTTPPGVGVGFNGLTNTGSFLFDTGAQASIISEQLAATLGVTYDTTNTDPENPTLLGAPSEDQFVLQVGGVGGTSSVAGFLLDTLTLPTIEGEPLVFKRAPVLVLDITVLDPVTLDEVTLAGILGMNFLLPSFDPGTFEIAAGAFDFVTFDHTTGKIGLTLNPAVVPTPGTLALLAWGALALARRRRAA